MNLGVGGRLNNRAARSVYMWFEHSDVLGEKKLTRKENKSEEVFQRLPLSERVSTERARLGEGKEPSVLLDAEQQRSGL